MGFKEDMFNEIMEEAQLINEYKNNGKIAIKDEIIENVPLVNYPGLTVEECLKVRELLQQLLIISKEDNDNNEVVITYSLEEEQLKKENRKYMTIVKGKEDETNIEADADTYHLLNATRSVVLINLHNHPSGSDFSMSDIMFFIKHDSLKLMIVIPNDGGVYYLSKDEKEFNRYENVIAFADIVHNVSPNAFKDGKIYFDKLSYDDMVKVSEEYIEQCSDYGMIYEFVSNKRIIRGR